MSDTVIIQQSTGQIIVLQGYSSDARVTVAVEQAQAAAAAAAASEGIAVDSATTSVAARDITTAARDIATGARDITTDARDSALDSAARAENAEVAAALHVGLFPNTAAGIAGVADGMYFAVPSADEREYVILYQRSGASAIDVKHASNVAQLAEISVEGYTDPIAAMFGGKGPDGKLYEILSFLLDGSIRSPAINNLVSSRLGGSTIEVAEASGWGALVITALGPDGKRYAVAGIRDDNTIYAPGIASLDVNTVVIHIPLLGQSNTTADEAIPRLTTSPTGYGNYRFTGGIKTWDGTQPSANQPQLRPATFFSFAPLIGEAVANNETRANGLADALGAQLKRASRYSPQNLDVGPHILISTSAVGSRGVVELGPEDDGDTSSDPGRAYPGGHWPTMMDDIVRAKAQAESIGMKYQVPFWCYDQGERESGGLIYRYLPPYALSVARQMYYDRCLTMAQAFDTTVRGITGQTRPIPVLVTPACGSIITTSAWLDLSNASQLVFAASPRYQTRSALNQSDRTGSAQRYGNFLHHTPDAHRWTGEQEAKVAYRIFVLNQAWKPFYARSAVKIGTNQIDVTFNVPRPPMVVDTSWLPKMKGWGFSMWSGLLLENAVGEQFATAYEIRPEGNVIRFTFANPVPANAKFRIGNTQDTDFGFNPAVVAIAAGPTTPNGFATTNFSFAGDIRKQISTLTQEGAFYILSLQRVTSSTIRSLVFDGTYTVMNAEDRETLTSGGYVQIPVGDTVKFLRIISATNLRDSDDALSINTFAQGSDNALPFIPNRTGQLYPLWNWCWQYDGLPVQGT